MSLDEENGKFRYNSSFNAFNAIPPISSAGNKQEPVVYIGESKPTIAHATSRALKDATRLVTSLREVRHGFSADVGHVQSVLASLIRTLPSLKTALADNSERLRESVDVIQQLAENVIDKVSVVNERRLDAE